MNDSHGSQMVEPGFVVADPHVVYYDAVSHSPWDHDGGGRLPDKDDWSTYRYTVQDVILGVATHRFNKNNRRLEIRAYFVGEHPIFEPFEPTKAMLIVFCCQCYQAGGSLELFFEHGVPFDIRELIERRLDVVVSGHQQLLDREIMLPLFAALSDLPLSMQNRIAAQGLAIEKVCYNTYRGTWAPNHIKGMLQTGVPLRRVFQRRPDPLREQLIHADLVNQLRVILLEEYAVRRLENRQMGQSLGKRVNRVDGDGCVWYHSATRLDVDDGESQVDLLPETRFAIVPVLPLSTGSIPGRLQTQLQRVFAARTVGSPILAMPMDFIYLSDKQRSAYAEQVRQAGAQLLIVGLTATQLLTEAEMNLAVTATEINPDEVDATNVDRFPD